MGLSLSRIPGDSRNSVSNNIYDESPYILSVFDKDLNLTLIMEAVFE
jgi:hypothetical protein